MTKSYTWEEIKEFIVKELSKTKHIMTWGTIGSLNVEHDIDTIITKKPESFSSDFYKEVHGIFDRLDVFLKKYNGRAVRFSFSPEEFIIYGLIEKRANDLSFHTMIYTSYSQILKDWAWSIFSDDNMKEILLNNYSCLLGSVEDLFSKEFIKERYYDPIFILLYLYDKINSHLPEKILLESMNHSYDYLYRKRLGLKAPICKNEKEIRKSFYKLCEILDELEKN